MRMRSLLIPTLAMVVGLDVAQAADDLQIHGFVSQGFLLTKNNAIFTPDSEDSGTFEFNELALNVVATPIDRLRVGVQIAAQDLGNSFNNQPTIDWAYGNYSFGEIANGLDLAVSAGRFKMGHGLYNDFRDLDMTRPSVFLPMSVYNPRWRDLILAINGIEVNLTAAAGAFGSFEFNAYMGDTSFSASEGALHDLFVDTGMDPSSLNVEAIRGGQVTWATPVDGLRLKYSLLNGSQFVAQGTYAGAAAVPGFVPGTDYSLTIPNYWDNIASVEYVWNNLMVAAEYNYVYYQTTVDGTLNIGGPQVPVSRDSSNRTDAAYISAAYRMHPKWEALGGWQWSQGESEGAQNTKKKWYAFNAAIRFDVTEHWLIKAEYQWTHGDGLLRASEQADGTREEIWSLFALKTTFDF